MQTLLAIISQPHFLLAVLLPGAITFGVLIRTPFRRKELLGLAVAIALTALQTTPSIQLHLHILGRPPEDLQVLPIYPIVLLLQLHHSKIALGKIFAGTFLAGLVADVVWAIRHPCCAAWFSIGGDGLVDGLLIQPLCAIAIGILANGLRDRRSLSLS